MGNFEKLSVLVIVVIIVMILVVAIYEWTGSPSDGAGTTEQARAKDVDTPPPQLPTPGPFELPATPKPAAADPAGAKKPVQGGVVGPNNLSAPAPAPKDGNWWEIDPNKPLIPEKDPATPPDGKPESKDGLKGTGPAVEPTDKPTVKEIAETTHIIASGDTYGALSLKYYGTTRYVARIEEANPGVSAHSLRLGAKIKIPAMKIEAGKAPASGAGRTDDTAIASSGERPVPGKEYKVRSSDTWERISKEAYKTSERWPEIFMKNMKLTPSPRDLRPGLVIMIPR